MPARADIEQRVSRSAGALVKAVRRQLDRWIREGMTTEEILEQLGSFRLPSAEQAKLRQEVRSAMRQIAGARSEFRGGNIETVMAASELTLGDLNTSIRSHLVRETRRTLASGAGVETLRRRLERQEIGNAATLANTAVASFNNLLTFQQAAIAGTETFLYAGPVSAITRPFCRAHAGKVFSREQIEQMDNGQGLPVAESCGGYNCRHEWLAHPDGVAMEGKPVTVDGATYLLDEKGEQELFARERRLYVEAHKAELFGSDARSLTAARALARVHDGFNPTMTNTLSDGVWKVVGRDNFERHYLNRNDPTIQTRDAYRQAMMRVTRNPDADVFGFLGNKGQQMYIVHDNSTRWLVMLDDRGLLHTAFRKSRTMRSFWTKKQHIGKLKDFVGEFRA